MAELFGDKSYLRSVKYIVVKGWPSGQYYGFFQGPLRSLSDSPGKVSIVGLKYADTLTVHFPDDYSHKDVASVEVIYFKLSPKISCLDCA